MLTTQRLILCVTPPLMLFPFFSCTPKRKLRQQRRTAYLRGLDGLTIGQPKRLRLVNFFNLVDFGVANHVSTWLISAKSQPESGCRVTRLKKLTSGKIRFNLCYFAVAMEVDFLLRSILPHCTCKVLFLFLMLVLCSIYLCVMSVTDEQF